MTWRTTRSRWTGTSAMACAGKRNDNLRKTYTNFFRNHLAGLCDGDQLLKIKTIYREVVKQTGRPVNLVMIDYVGEGAVRLSDVVLDINKCNVLLYKFAANI